jgi:acetoin utilization deacetylase AcuC-like enzyme
MSLLVATHDECLLHDPGPGHPERSLRLTAVLDGVRSAGVADAVTWVEAPLAPLEQLTRIHPASVLERVERLCEAGGGAIDPDTWVSADSWNAARRAAGAGLDLIERLRAGEADVGWSIVRPPGHHATAGKQMGFCLVNNVSVAAAALADAGERVAIIDIDAHHGNGTQDIFWEDPRVLFVSLHQYPWYPYTGRADEIGGGEGRWSTVNIPLPAGATGQVFRRAFDEVIAPVVARHQTTWILVSAGFDGHRADPITDLGLSSADYADLAADILGLVPAGRRLLFLEGGYDLPALRDCAGAVAATAVGERFRPESPTSGGPGDDHVEVARGIHLEGALDLW